MKDKELRRTLFGDGFYPNSVNIMRDNDRRFWELERRLYLLVEHLGLEVVEEGVVIRKKQKKEVTHV